MSRSEPTIRIMHPAELQIAINWAKEEGWDPGIHDAECFYATDPEGFFIMEHNNEPIAVVSAVNYDTQSSFWGLYIVKGAYRGKGLGMRMTRQCQAHAQRRNSGLDGVIENVEIYSRIGFKKYFENTRYEYIGAPANHDKNIHPLSDIPFDAILAYDKQCFFGDREAFLKKWITQKDATALGYVDGGVLKGFGVCRQCYSGYKIGPLFADSMEVAESLFLSLQAYKQGKPIYLDVPEINEIGQALAQKFQMKKVFATARMYNKGLPDLHYDKIVGITTFEVG